MYQNGFMKQRFVTYKKMKSYQIIDNGAIPFIVTVNNNEKSVQILKQQFRSDTEDDSELTLDDYINLKKILYKAIYIGKDPKNFTDGMGETWEKSYEGNSILLKISAKKFVYIGSEIYSFELDDGDKAVKYYSPMGPSGVPYPYLIGKKNTYFMLDNQAVPNEFLDLTKDAYDQFYHSVTPSNKHSMKNVNMIENRMW
jgi:hypothetical protein